MGPNVLYWNNILSETHDGSQTVIELITHSSISSNVNNYEDYNATKYCKIFIAKLGVWSYEVTKADV